MCSLHTYKYNILHMWNVRTLFPRLHCGTRSKRNSRKTMCTTVWQELIIGFWRQTHYDTRKTSWETCVCRHTQRAIRIVTSRGIIMHHNHRVTRVYTRCVYQPIRVYIRGFVQNLHLTDLNHRTDTFKTYVSWIENGLKTRPSLKKRRVLMKIYHYCTRSYGSASGLAWSPKAAPVLRLAPKKVSLRQAVWSALASHSQHVVSSGFT